MGRRKNYLWSLLLAGCFCMTAVMSSFAGVISSVSIRVDSGLEPGDTLPDIAIRNDADASADNGGIEISVSSDRFTITDAKWVTSTSRKMEVGDKPEMKVWLTPVNEDDYYFKGTYRSSNVSVRGGEFSSASISSGQLVVRLKVNPIKGAFPAPEDAYWKSSSRGTARWEKPSDGSTGTYEVILKRGSGTVHRVETRSTSYNFYPYMTSAGTYSFKVRTIARTDSEEKYGTKSEWVESDELYIAKEDVSDGSGRENGDSNGGPSGNTRVGWQYIDNYWYYYYPDGTYQKNSWLYVGDRWYLFQSDGKMLKGWQNKDGYTFYLTDNGDMVTGWVQTGGRWYYLNAGTQAPFGVMMKNSWVNLDGKIYYLLNDGIMAEGWNQIDGNWYYFYPGAGNRATDTYIDTFYVNADGVWKK